MTHCRRRRVAALLIAAAPLLPACTAMSAASDPPAPAAARPGPAAALDGTAWVLRSLPGRSAVPAPPGPSATMAFADGRVSGSDGCNRYGGPYAASAATLALGPGLISTRMACAGAAGELAAAFGPVLAAARGWRIAAGELALLDAQGAVLATFSAQPAGLAGTAWEVSGYNTGRQAVSSVRAGSRITLEFSADGGLSGSSGCNRFSGPWTLAGGALRVGPLRTTRMACEPEVMQQEAAFLAALQGATVVRREGERLELRTAEGALAATATAASR